MTTKAAPALSLEICPLTAERWDDLIRLFGPRGAYGGCWCMWWRTSRAEFEAQTGEGNKRAFESLVRSGEVCGLLAYTDGEAVGWCALAPRQAYPRLERSRTLKRIDERPVWSVTCFYVAKGYRKQGVARALLRSAVEYAREQGAEALEGYPVDSHADKLADASVYTGTVSVFLANGFVEVARRSDRRPIMRYLLSS